MRRWISLAVAMAMFTPAVASAAEGTMANWLSPQPGQIVSGGKVEVAIGYNTQSKLKVDSLELYVDGQFSARKILGTPESRGVCSFWWDTARVEQGTHNLVVKVFVGDQMISKVFGTATVGPNGSSRGMIDVRPPVVTFANIRSKDVLKGKTTVKMNATDDSGQSPMVSLLVDDVLKLLKNTPPYTYDLDTTTYSDGSHALKTYAYDGAGNRSDPAVANVTFRNGATKPIVTTMSVNHESTAQVPDETVSQVAPPAVNAASEPSTKQSAARAESRIDRQTSTARPAVASAQPQPKPRAVSAAPKAEPKMVALAPKPAVSPKHALSAPKLESKLRTVPVSIKSHLLASRVAPQLDARMAAAAPKVKVIRTDVSAAKRTAPVLANKPVKMASPLSSVSVRKQIAKPALSPTMVAAKPSVVEHAPESVKPRQALSAPKPSGALRMAMAHEPISLRRAAPGGVPGAAVAKAPVVVDRAAASSVKQMAVKPAIDELKDVETADAAMSAATAAPPVTVVPAKLSKTELKRVRVAFAPDLRGAESRLRTSPAISRPPSIPKPTPARIEKTTVPASGKVKARAFFEQIGAALFWDPSTHTITACVGSIVFEMQIGSKIARVNGHDMMMESAPVLIGDRAVFDAEMFAQACNFADKFGAVSKAELN
jgi:hypothetical protein